MKIRNRRWAKLLVATALLVLSLFASFLIRDVLTLKAPENAIPEIKVYHNNVLLPDNLVHMSSYSWRILFKAMQGTAIDPDAWMYDADPPWIAPGARLKFDFSLENKDLIVWCSREDGPFQLLTGDIYTSTTPGKYTYKIWAGWGAKGSVLYYVNIQIPQ